MSAAEGLRIAAQIVEEGAWSEVGDIVTALRVHAEEETTVDPVEIEELAKSLERRQVRLTLYGGAKVEGFLLGVGYSGVTLMSTRGMRLTYRFSEIKGIDDRGEG